MLLTGDYDNVFRTNWGRTLNSTCVNIPIVRVALEGSNIIHGFFFFSYFFLIIMEA